MVNEPEEKKTGIAHLFAAGGYSMAGLKRALGESAFRHEITFFLAALVLFFIVRATAFEFVILAILFLILFAVEAINTAIEELVDRVSPEISSTGKNAKDLGSFAVFCMLSAISLYLASVVLF